MVMTAAGMAGGEVVAVRTVAVVIDTGHYVVER